MEYNIYDLMEGIADDTITLSPSGTADLRRIEELTMNKIKEQNEGRRVKKPVRRVTRMMLVAAIAAALCAVTVVAVAGNATGKVTPADTAKAGEMDDKSTAAFSDGISTQQADIRDANGNTIQLPEMERVPTDPETAQRLVGGYLMTLDNATVTIENNYYGDYTITLETMLIDEKGAGMITYYVENPKGVAYRTKGLSYGAVEHTQMPMVGVATPEMVDASGRWVSHESYLDEENTTDTHVQAVLYFSVCGDYKKGETIYVSFNWGGRRCAEGHCHHPHQLCARQDLHREGRHSHGGLAAGHPCGYRRSAQRRSEGYYHPVQGRHRVCGERLRRRQ